MFDGGQWCFSGGTSKSMEARCENWHVVDTNLYISLRRAPLIRALAINSTGALDGEVVDPFEVDLLK